MMKFNQVTAKLDTTNINRQETVVIKYE